MRKLIAVAIACSTFGGVIGVLITAATQSQASPAAIAAAVQRVQDLTADRSLTNIQTQVKQASTDLNDLTTDLNPKTGELYQMAVGIGEVREQLLAVLEPIAKNTYGTCQGTSPDPIEACQYLNPDLPATPALP